MNDLTISQGYEILNQVVAQASGTEALAKVDGSNFIAVATTAQQIGAEQLTNALTQVLSRTIFRVRPYYRKLSSLMVSQERYGNHVRKVNFADLELTEDKRLGIEDNTSVDQQKVRKPKLVQTNFYGETAYSDHITIFKDQWDTALQNPYEFTQLVSGIFTSITDRIEKAHEEGTRFTLCNLINGTTKKIKLIESYNQAKGTALTYNDILKKENFTDFFQFAYACIITFSGLLTERTTEYSTQLTGNPIPRHTPKENQRLFALSYFNNLVETTVLSSVFHDSYLKSLNFELVNYWQSIKTPEKIQGKFNKLNPANGQVIQDDMESPSAPIFAVLFDNEACGVTTVNQWANTAPFNADGGYTNYFWHFTDRYWNDFTEQSVVFTLE